MNEDQEIEFNNWWHEVGSGITPLPHQDKEDHAKRVAFMSYCACLENNKLKEVAQEVTRLIAKHSYQNYNDHYMRLCVDINQELEELLDKLDELSKPDPGE